MDSRRNMAQGCSGAVFRRVSAEIAGHSCCGPRSYGIYRIKLATAVRPDTWISYTEDLGGTTYQNDAVSPDEQHVHLSFCDLRMY